TSLAIGAHCTAVVGGPEDGLFAVDRIPGPPDTPAGRSAGWRVLAPSGTRISRLVTRFYLGQRSSGEWLPYIATNEGSVLESCVPPGGQTTCERGVSSYDPFAPAGVYSVDTAGLEVGVRCTVSMGACGTGALLHAAWAALYDARVQITENTPPTLS